MDPLTQGLIGAAAAQAVLGRSLGRRAAAAGALAGVLPDADVFIRSASDPLLAIEYHRQFTHSLAFIPIGGAIATLPWLLARSGRASWRLLLVASIVGYATHGLLDACTTYGTQLFWPFTRTRVAWHVVSIIDPLFTLALAVGVGVAVTRRSRAPAAIALVFCMLYLASGLLQRNRALSAQREVAAARGHDRARGEVFPTVGNQLVWRSLYESDDTLYADRIRVSWSDPSRVTPGTAVRAYTLSRELAAQPRVARDFARFRWFSGGWVAAAPADPTVIGDARYSLRTDAFEPIWGVRFHPHDPVPTEWVNRTRERKIDVRTLWREIRNP